MENSLLMGAAAVMKMAVEMAAVSMEKPSGALPRPAGAGTETPVPPDLGFATAAALELFSYRGFLLMILSLSLRPRGPDLMLFHRLPQLPKLRLLSGSCDASIDSLLPFQRERCSCCCRSSSFCKSLLNLTRTFQNMSLLNDPCQTFPFFKDLRGVISSLEAFASQFTSLEADKIRLQEEAKSSSSKLEGAIKKAAVARQEVDSLKEELNKLKERLKEEEARAAEKDELLRQSALALLEAADIPATALDKIPSNSPANGVSTVLAAHQLTRGLLDKGKGALARMHSMIFPKATQEKTLGQLIDAFAVDTKEVIEVFKRTSRTYGALLAFQLMMGYGFKADIEEMTKELPKGKDGRSIDLSTFTASARTCARQLLDLVSRKTSVGPSLSTQTQAP
ncbi:hypothetical protein QYE76_024167 [Lolium multiflorum]|uniref:Uncharacterized protein n=1 Tax=Lolium multiflorum TaxID=4521 RepID=A0AAD8VVG8_LOLMU|nr:hypothetical protein QYE76_024167 [Lolium multiflorum]